MRVLMRREFAMTGHELPDYVLIVDPISRAPLISGEAGRAWRADLSGVSARAGRDAGDYPTVVFWVIECPWADPAWHSYALILVRLRDLSNHAVVHLQGATHEVR